MVRVVADSTMDLPPDLVASHRITVVPIHVHFNGDTYLDRVTLSEEDFYRLVAEREVIPKTSQPSPGEFVDVYRGLAREADHILSLHISSKLSGTYQSAVQAAQIVAEEVSVTVFDTLSGSAGLGFMALEAARMAEGGEALEVILERLAWMRDVMRIYLMLDNLKFAQMSGRVTAIQHVVASVLRLKPIIAVRDGLLAPVDRVRTHQRALLRLVSLLREEHGARPVHVAVVHAQAPEHATRLLDLVQEQMHVRTALVTTLSVSVAAHLGPGTLGIVAYPVMQGDGNGQGNGDAFVDGPRQRFSLWQ